METYKVEVTSIADRDLGEIFEYVAVTLAAPKAATGLVSRLYDSMRSLSASPLRCPAAKDAYLARQGFRTLFVDNYIVFYVVNEDAKQVIVHRVIYAKRNYRQLFVRGDQEKSNHTEKD